MMQFQQLICDIYKISFIFVVVFVVLLILLFRNYLKYQKKIQLIINKNYNNNNKLKEIKKKIIVCMYI
jgi:hypothetical protein